MKQPRNAPCQCGSGRKAKRCCLLKQAHDAQQNALWRKADHQKLFDRFATEADNARAPGPSYGMPRILRPSHAPTADYHYNTHP